MGKKILCIYYSQSGQITEVVTSFFKSFSSDSVDIVRVKPISDFPFPWTSPTFFDAMPESVLGVPVELEPFDLKETRYDLVVLAYQPWYLSPSIPATSILKHRAVKQVLANTPVVTVIVSRNMWLNAQEKVKVLLAEADAKLVGNIALVDRHPNLVSVVTILYWMMGGKKDRYLGLFPMPGVSQKDIDLCAVYGQTVLKHLEENALTTLQPRLVEQKAVEVDYDYMFIEGRGGRIFPIWANLIGKKQKKRAFLLRLFKWELIIALFVLSPFLLLINRILLMPFNIGKLRRKKAYYLGLN
jgi:hypothetical protein